MNEWNMTEKVLGRLVFHLLDEEEERENEWNMTEKVSDRLVFHH